MDATPRLPRPGEHIAGTYRVLRELGAGGMGVVYAALDESLKREVAIKFVGPTVAALAKEQGRMQQEARAMAAVRHPNVVRIYSYGEHRGAPYFVMELVPGKDLTHWLDRYTEGDPPSIDEALGIIDQICCGVAAIHAEGIVHGDLKPANVLLGPAYHVAVTDFGLFRAMGGSSYEGMVVGTPAYIAPEIVLGTAKVASACSDIYAAGVLAYQILTGELVVPIRSHADMFARHSKPDERPSASEHRAELPSGIDAVLQMATHPDPSARPKSVEDFRRALLAARQSAAVQPPSIRIVVADDDPDFLSLISETLGFAFPGSVIECVSDGGSALATLDERRADLAVIDLDMPGLNGVELTAAIRARKGLRDLPILVVTARGGATDWKLLQSMGADGLLLKPIDAYALIAMARRVLGVAAVAR